MRWSHVAGWNSESPTPAQLKEFFAQIETGRITKERLQAFLRGEKADVSVLLADWQKFYRELFNLEVDFSELVVPATVRGFDRLIIVAPRITPQRVYEKCSELFPCWKWTNKSLDDVVQFNQSEMNSNDGAYAVWFRDRVEADMELQNLSANDLKVKGISSITLEERLLYELKYFKETGNHLDIDNWTLCAGSRFSNGHVPVVNYLIFRRLNVYECSPNISFSHLRSRRAVR